MKDQSTRIAVGDVDGSFEGGAEENADYSLAGVPGDPIVVVDDAEEDEGVDDDLVDRPRRDLLRLHDIHRLRSHNQTTILLSLPLSLSFFSCAAGFPQYLSPSLNSFASSGLIYILTLDRICLSVLDLRNEKFVRLISRSWAHL